MPDPIASPYPVSVSRHALARFRERIYDASDKTIIAHILTPRVRALLASGVRCIRGINGLNIHAKHGTVTTVAPATWKRRYGVKKRSNLTGRRTERRPRPEVEHGQ